jgi:hypothetical protein
MELENYKQRASGLGSIISKSGKMTQGVQTYLQDRYVELKTDQRKDITSKYFEKGISTEQAIIDLVNQYFFPGKFITKNREHKENDYLTGTADLIEAGCVFDIKSAWDAFTFQKAELGWNYEWQLRAYMELWNIDKAFLVYGLVDMPEHLMTKEKKSIYYSGVFDDFDDPNYIDACKEMEAKFTFSHLPIESRLKVWEIDRESSTMDEIIDRVNDARGYLLELEQADKDNALELERIKELLTKQQ